MNNRLSLEFGRTYARIPLKAAPHILHGDALETDWAELLPPEECDYVLGNPPFGGAKFQSPEQRAQVRADRGARQVRRHAGLCRRMVPQGGGDYARAGRARIGFVATNSITQGEQVAQLWPLLFDRCRLEIAFAHRTFAWGSTHAARRMCMSPSSASTAGRTRRQRSACSPIPI